MMCELRKNKLKWVFTAFIFFYVQPKSMITFKRWEKANVSDTHG